MTIIVGSYGYDPTTWGNIMQIKATATKSINDALTGESYGTKEVTVLIHPTSTMSFPMDKGLCDKMMQSIIELASVKGIHKSMITQHLVSVVMESNSFLSNGQEQLNINSMGTKFNSSNKPNLVFFKASSKGCGRPVLIFDEWDQYAVLDINVGTNKLSVNVYSKCQVECLRDNSLTEADKSKISIDIMKTPMFSFDLSISNSIEKNKIASDLISHCLSDNRLKSRIWIATLSKLIAGSSVVYYDQQTDKFGDEFNNNHQMLLNVDGETHSLFTKTQDLKASNTKGVGRVGDMIKEFDHAITLEYVIEDFSFDGISNKGSVIVKKYNGVELKSKLKGHPIKEIVSEINTLAFLGL